MEESQPAHRRLWVYILDSSVATLILDGELWSREPGLLVRYHTDLQATLLHPDSKLTIGDLEVKSSTVQRSVNAWKWAQSVMQNPNADTKMLLTPTVQAELQDAQQFREQAWRCFEEVGFEELYDKCYHVAQVEVSAVLSTLESELMAAIAPKNLTALEEKAVQPAINAFSRVEAMEGLRKDVQIYIEACIAHRKLYGKVVMLVTDDHKFFRVFAKSMIAENILMSQVQMIVKEARCTYRSPGKNGVEEIHPPIRVRLAGEIIPGILADASGFCPPPILTVN